MEEFPSQKDIKKGRIFTITDTTFKILCQADRKNFDPTTGLENLVAMYLSLSGPIDFKKLDLERAKVRAKKMDLF